MLEEKARFYYGTMEKNCAEAILLAANDVYELNLSESDISLFAGFGGGMGCGSTCGALSGAMPVLSRLFGTRENFRDLCGAFVSEFQSALGAQDCETLSAKYKTEADRCVQAVGMTARVLESYIEKLSDKPAVSADGCTLSPEDIKRVKAIGFLHQKGTNKFNARIITRNGRITDDECRVISEAAKLYGDGHMMLTTRLTMEVSGVDYKDVDAFQQYVAKAGLTTGGTGSKVRPVVCCKGTTCQYGLYDTYELSEAAHDRFYIGYDKVSLPHKFKIAFGGCPNNCVKPNLNDIGIVGAKVPQYDESICRGCKKCQVEAACPIHAAKLTDGKLVIDQELCNNCGRCVSTCPFHCADEGTYGWRITIGGRWGKKNSEGQMLRKLFTSREDVLDTIEKAILFFRSEGIPGERFADTIERVGFEKAESMILSDELMERKSDILGMKVVGGASC